jgi:hypothetical protein
MPLKELTLWSFVQSIGTRNLGGEKGFPVFCRRVAFKRN